MNRWFRTYDHRDADERLDNIEGMYDPRDESDAKALATLPGRQDVLPPCIKRKPLGRSTLDSVVSRLASQSSGCAPNAGRLVAGRDFSASGTDNYSSAHCRSLQRYEPTGPGVARYFPRRGCDRSVFRRGAAIHAGTPAGAMALASVQCNRPGQRSTAFDCLVRHSIHWRPPGRSLDSYRDGSNLTRPQEQRQ